LWGAGGAGALLGAFVMVGMAPDTGMPDTPAEPAAAVVVDPKAPVPEPATAGAPNVLPGQTVEQVLAGDPGKPQELRHWTIDPNSGNPVRPEGDPAPPPPAEGTPLTPDVLGVEQLFSQRADRLRPCTQSAPEPIDGREQLMVVMTLVDKGGKTEIGALRIGNDPDNQFSSVASCAAGALQGANFGPMPDAQPRQVSWFLKL
jgi:hypothetical protein